MLVTAVITTYNRPQLGRRAIGSVLAQTYQPLEIVVVEDGSNTGLEAWLRAEALKQVRYIRHSENRGLPAGRNTGLRLARGDYIAYLDDDDEWKPERIEKQMQLLARLSLEEEGRLGVIHCGHEIHFTYDSRIVIDHPRNQGKLREAIICQGAKTVPSSCLFSKAALQEVGGFDERLVSSIDHDIWMALAASGYESRILDEPLVVSYVSRDDRRMTTDFSCRIRGVRQFVEKWQPIYQEWFGAADGTAYAQRYFVRVIAPLAAARLAAGDLPQAWKAVRAIFNYSCQTGYNSAILARQIAINCLPAVIVRWMVRIKGWLGLRVSTCL